MGRRMLVLGHRGASRAATENTLAAFARAGAMGADGVELDVRRTADEVLVVHHDPHVPGARNIVDTPFAQLRAEHPEVPMLVEALAACEGMLVNVEIKCLPWEPDADGPDRPVARAVVDAVRAHAPGAIISSFDLGAVDVVRALAPELDTAWLTSGQDVASAAALMADGHGHHWLNPDRVSALATTVDVVEAIHRQGRKLNAWTVDDPDEIRALAALGFDAIITNVPDVALAALR